MTLIDIALMHQAVQLDPVLAAISDFNINIMISWSGYGRIFCVA